TERGVASRGAGLSGSHHHHRAGRHLAFGVAITFGFGLVEAIGGWWSGSLALISDAGHMLSDSFALGLAAAAERIAYRKGTRGDEMHGIELGAALINTVMMAIIVLWIVYEAIERFEAPEPVMGEVVIGIAFIGIVINLIVARVISHGEQTLNARAAMLHVLGDLAGSVVALISGITIYLTGWLPIDPILSLVVAALIGFATLNLLREALKAVRGRRPT